MTFDDKFKLILESYPSLLIKNRVFYPRNFALSEEFLKAFKQEHARLKAMKIDDKRILQKITKALMFHGREN